MLLNYFAAKSNDFIRVGLYDNVISRFSCMYATIAKLIGVICGCYGGHRNNRFVAQVQINLLSIICVINFPGAPQVEHMTARAFYRFAVCIWILFGLSWVAGIISSLQSLMQSGIEKGVDKGGEKLGLAAQHDQASEVKYKYYRNKQL